LFYIGNTSTEQSWLLTSMASMVEKFMAPISLTGVLFMKWSNSVCTKVKYLQLSLNEPSKAILKPHFHCNSNSYAHYKKKRLSPNKVHKRKQMNIFPALLLLKNMYELHQLTVW